MMLVGYGNWVSFVKCVAFSTVGYTMNYSSVFEKGTVIIQAL